MDQTRDMDIHTLLLCLSAYDVAADHAVRVLSQEQTAAYEQKGDYLADGIWESYGNDPNRLLANKHTAWQQVITMRSERLLTTLDDCDGMFPEGLLGD